MVQKGIMNFTEKILFRTVCTVSACMMCLSVSAQPQAPRDLSLALERLQASGAGVFMPDPATPYREEQGPVPLTPGFPQEFCEGLIAVDVEGISTFPVTLRTDDATGEMRYFNAMEEMFWIEYPEGTFAADWIANLRGVDPADPLYLPSHVEVSFTLMDEQDVEAYRGVRSVQQRALELSRKLQKKQSPVRLSSSSPLFIKDFRAGTNAFEFVTEYPDPLFGNAFDLFHTSDLVSGRWRMLGRIPVDPYTNAVSFAVPFSIVPGVGVAPPEQEGDPVTIIVISPLDPGVAYTNVITSYRPAPAPTGFFQLGTLIDGDFDGMTDAYERLVSLTDPNDPIDALIDSDGDGLPNSYEFYYGTDPLVPDSESIPRLIIKHNPTAPNEFATFQAAFNASVPYSIIEVKDGEYVARDVLFPPHPILLMSENWGKSRGVIIRNPNKSYLERNFIINQADNRTIIRGLHLRMETSDTSTHRIGFWVGANSTVSGTGASPVFDGVIVELADATYNNAFYILKATPQPVVFMNCVIAQRYGCWGMRTQGVYAIDPPPLLFENCTFLSDPGNPYSFAAQLETTPSNAGGALPVIPVTFNNCLWDAGFNTNALDRAPFAKLQKCPWTAYSVSMKNCIVPFPVEDYPSYSIEFFFESATNLFIAPIQLAVDGHLRAPLPHAGTPSRLVPFYDFEGQPRNPLAPTIGADEFIPLTGPPDAFGITGWDKIILYGLSPYIVDYDGDNIEDSIEIMGGTSPFDASEYCLTLSGAPYPRLATAWTNLFAGLSFSANVSGVFASAPVEPDGSFTLPHTVIHTNAPLRFALFRTNGNYTGFISMPFKPTSYHSKILPSHTIFTQDSDFDRIPDWWEIFHGFNPFSLADAYDDPDEDGLVNLHEYWCGTNPRVSDVCTTSNALANAAHAIDSRLVGKNPANALGIFGEFVAYTNNAANGIFIRNPDCWAADIDLTCCSPWHNFVWTLWPPIRGGNEYAGTLISPRHVLFAAHFDQIATNTTMTFVDMNNQAVTRTLVDKRAHTNLYGVGSTVLRDFTVGILNEDVPPSISFAKILPDDYADYLHTGYGLPCIRLDRKERALVGNISSLETTYTHPVGGIDYRVTTAKPPDESLRDSFHEGLMDGDSGNPCFLIINSQPVILTVWTGTEYGSSIHSHKSALNYVMSWLSNKVGATTNYQLTEIDLSGFTKLSLQP